jgi:hypothetical protein
VLGKELQKNENSKRISRITINLGVIRVSLAATVQIRTRRKKTSLATGRSVTQKKLARCTTQPWLMLAFEAVGTDVGCHILTGCVLSRRVR